MVSFVFAGESTSSDSGGSSPSPGPEPTVVSSYIGSYSSGGNTYSTHYSYTYSGSQYGPGGNVFTVCNTCSDGSSNSSYTPPPPPPPPPTPSATLEACKVSASGGCVSGTRTGGTLSLKYNERAKLIWTSTNAVTSPSACKIPYVDTTLPKSGTRNLSTSQPTQGAVRTYSVSCRNSANVWSPQTAATKVTVRRYVKPSVQISSSPGSQPCPSYVRSCAGIDLVVSTSDNLLLSWQVNNTSAVNTCTLTDTETGTTWSGSPNKSNVDVGEPSNNDTRTFEVNCTGPGGTATDSFTVLTLDALTSVPPVTIEIDPLAVRSGDPFSISWDIDDTLFLDSTCELYKNGKPMTPPYIITTAEGSITNSLEQSATYMIVCTANSDSYYGDFSSEEKEIIVLPKTQET